MKTSDALLLILQANGGTVRHTQFDEWLAQLRSAGLVTFDTRGEGDRAAFLITLTEKGRQHVRGKAF